MIYLKNVTRKKKHMNYESKRKYKNLEIKSYNFRKITSDRKNIRNYEKLLKKACLLKTR